MYLVKGVINDFTQWGDPPLLRHGTVHFLPNSEVYLSHYFSTYVQEKGIFVRGYHRNGLLITSRTAFKCFKSLELEKMEDFSEKTLKFIDKNWIRVIKSEYDLKSVNELLLHFKKLEKTHIEQTEIDDKVFVNAVKFTADFQQAILNQIPVKELMQVYFKFPITITNRLKQEKYQIDENDFITNHSNILTDKFKQSILNVDLNTIFPTNRRMFIGEALVSISNRSKFKIILIEQNSYI